VEVRGMWMSNHLRAPLSRASQYNPQQLQGARRGGCAVVLPRVFIYHPVSSVPAASHRARLGGCLDIKYYSVQDSIHET
jgi:hypothetical protein